MRAGKNALLAAIVIGLFASMFAFGYFYPYWRKADQDMVLTYQGLLLNDGAPQNYFDHTGYFYFLLISLWQKGFHLIGLLPFDRLSDMPKATNVAAYEEGWTVIVRNGRILSALLASIFVIAFAGYLRAFFRDTRLVALGALAIALSGSLLMHARIMRTELLAAFFTTTALMAVLVATREKGPLRHGLLCIAAGLCAVLSVETKVQALIPLMTFPVVALFFGEKGKKAAHESWGVAAAMALLVAFALPAAAGVLWNGFEHHGMYTIEYKPLGRLPDGLYQAVLLAWPLLGIGVYTLVWKRSSAEAARAVIGLALGGSLGVFALLLRYHPQNVAALTHPIEHMLSFASNAEAQPGPLTVLGMALFQGLGEHTFFLNPSARPTLLVEWFAIGAAIVAWMRGARTAPLQAGVLILSAWAVDTVFSLRGIKDAYLIFTDPLLILAGLTMLAHFPALFEARAARRWGVGLACLALLWGHVEPIKLQFSKRGPERLCDALLPTYLPAERFPFCEK